MAAMYYAFIVNPAAGTGFALTTMEKLEEILRAKNTEYRVIRTERPGHGTEIAAELAKDDEITAVVSVGGDGTAGEIAAGLTGTGKPMGIIPAGTGNDFIKSAGIPNDPEKALEESEGRAADPDWKWGHRPDTLLGLEYHLAHEYEAQCPCCGKKMRPLRMDEGTNPADPLVCPKCGAKNRFTYGLHFINWD